MPDAYDVLNVGRDSSGRTIYMNRRMKAAFTDACTRSGVTPTIVQGAYRARDGGGASASAGTHDQGGCLDLRTWNLTDRQRRKFQRAARAVGWAAWYRTQSQGFDPHMHIVLLDDRDAAPSARSQMESYRSGRNGLASNGADDFWRPSPIPVYPQTLRSRPSPAERHDRRIIRRAANRTVTRRASNGLARLLKRL